MNNLDPKDVEGSTGMLVSQCRQIWEDSKALAVERYLSIQNIVLCGMGGSAYGGYVVNALFKNELKIPLYSNNDYDLPGFADENTLVILSSYSGTTEEVLSCSEAAKKQGCKICSISGGKKLTDAGLNFEPKFNPSGQPRLGTGYMVLGVIGILNKLGFLELTDSEVETAVKELEENQENIKMQAKELSSKIKESIPLVFAAQHLGGNAHILRNQFNETAKNFSAFSLLSELNHHLMEGLKNPEDKKLIVLFLSSQLYSERMIKRFELTKDVVSKQGIPYLEYKASGSNKLSQMLNALSFGGYLSLYLAFLYKIDPSLIPWVDYFKNELKKSS